MKLEAEASVNKLKRLWGKAEKKKRNNTVLDHTYI